MRPWSAARREGSPPPYAAEGDSRQARPHRQRQGVRAGHKKPANPKVDFDSAERVAARWRKQYVEQFDKYRSRGRKASGDVASDQILGNPVKDSIAGDKGDDKDRRDDD
ncbi:MAG TPA: hypothetical protein VNO33_10395 [Kofleriaceae bacterium]|nr:hypothetical protein [Kofleriaceae bacterium]